jgi:glycerol-3-phosphate acyltransferase PlsX
MAIVLDGMGSDNYPEPELLASLTSAKELKEKILLVGNEDVLSSKLSNLNKNNADVQIIHAKDVLAMHDHPVEASKTKPNNSMAVGLDLVKEGKASAFVTAGNTGAALFNAISILHKLPGIIRPALLTTLPTQSGQKCVFLDMGANSDCRPEFLLDFARMGKIYSERILGVSNPRVGLLAKGNQLVRDSHILLKHQKLNFIGNTEPKEIFAGVADVVITDGFTGNVFIKTSESVGRFIRLVLKKEIHGFVRKLGGLMVMPAFKALFKLMDPAEVGAGLLVGINGYVFIGHGRSDAKALISAIKLAKRAVDANLLSALKTDFQSLSSD